MYVWVLSYNPLTKLHSTLEKINLCAKSGGPVGGIRPIWIPLFFIPVLGITCIEGIANSYPSIWMGGASNIDPSEVPPQETRCQPRTQAHFPAPTLLLGSWGELAMFLKIAAWRGIATDVPVQCWHECLGYPMNFDPNPNNPCGTKP